MKSNWKMSCDFSIIRRSHEPDQLRSRPHTNTSGEYDVASREATNLPPSRQITESWTVAAAAPGAIRSVS